MPCVCQFTEAAIRLAVPSGPDVDQLLDTRHLADVTIQSTRLPAELVRLGLCSPNRHRNTLSQAEVDSAELGLGAASIVNTHLRSVYNRV